MNAKQTAQAAKEFRAYLNSAEGRRELEMDKLRRAQATLNSGHTLKCTLTKCDPLCTHVSKSIVIPRGF